MDRTEKKILEYMEWQDLPGKGENLLLSLSAGKDSMTLLHFFLNTRERNKWEPAVFHLNHRLRGEESDRDEEFLRSIADRYGIKMYTVQYDFSSVPGAGGSLEERARQVRYEYLNRIMAEHGFTRVATGHSGDDQVETLLYRIFTGTGPYGLTGIPADRGPFIRPLLCLSSNEIYQYLERNSIPWREDRSNRDTSFKRNVIRNEILPLVEKNFPMARGAILSLRETADEEHHLLLRFIRATYGEIVFYDRDSTIIHTEDIYADESALKFLLAVELRSRHGVYVDRDMLQEIYRNYSRNRTHLVLYENNSLTVKKTLLGNRPAVLITPRRMSHAIKDWEYLVDCSGMRAGDETIVDVKEASLKFFLRLVDYTWFMENRDDPEFCFISMDWGEVITIRNRRPGDIISLDRGTRKIKNVFIEKKLDNDIKDTIPLFVVNSRIAAIVFPQGYRVSKDFYVTDIAKKVLAIYKMPP